MDEIFYPVSNELLSSRFRRPINVSDKQIRAPVANAENVRSFYWWRITTEQLVVLRTVRNDIVPFTPHDYLLFNFHVATDAVCDSTLVVIRRNRPNGLLCAVEQETLNSVRLSPLMIGRNKKPLTPFSTKITQIGAIWTGHMFREFSVDEPER